MREKYDMERLEWAISTLEEREREAFEMWIDKVKGKDIAARLGTTIGRAHGLVCRALGKIRTRYPMKYQFKIYQKHNGAVERLRGKENG